MLVETKKINFIDMSKKQKVPLALTKKITLVSS